VAAGYEVFRLAAQDLAKRGLARQVSALLRAGRQTVREFLMEKYRVSIGMRQYFTPRGRTPDQADVSDFLRVLRRSAGQKDWRTKIKSESRPCEATLRTRPDTPGCGA
jgi:hypothetical protein